MIGEPEVPSPALTATAASLLSAAYRLRDLSARFDASSPDPDRMDRVRRQAGWTMQVATSLGMLSLAVERLAESGPRSLLATAALFPSASERERGYADIQADLRAELDLIAFLTLGDLTLDRLAVAEAHRRELPVGDLPWRDFMKAIDGDAGDPMRGAARTLDIVLREARTRLVAHRQPDHHWRMSTWDPIDSSPTLHLFADPTTRPAAFGAATGGL